MLVNTQEVLGCPLDSLVVKTLVNQLSWSQEVLGSAQEVLGSAQESWSIYCEEVLVNTGEGGRHPALWHKN